MISREDKAAIQQSPGFQRDLYELRERLRIAIIDRFQGKLKPRANKHRVRRKLKSTTLRVTMEFFNERH